jgi:iron complex outermembrane receptor protein
MQPRLIAATVAALFSQIPAFATPANPHDDATVIVTATRFADSDPRIPATISVITRDDIRRSPALGLPEVLNTVAGLDVRPLYGSLGVDAVVDLRGFGEGAGSNTLVLLDGQRLNAIDMGPIDWAAIPLESVQRIEIIRGAGTVLYGDRASGGVINIITDKSGRPRAAVTGTLGSHGHRSADAVLAGGNGALYFNLFARAAADDGWRDNAQQDQQAISGRVGLRSDQGEGFVDYAVFRDSSGLPGYLRSAVYGSDPRRSGNPADFQERDGHRLRPGLRYRLSPTLDLEAEITSAREDQHANYASFGSIADRTKDTLAFTPRLRWRHGLAGLPSETVVGLDHYDGRVDARYSSAPGQWADQTSSAIYLQNSTALAGAWTATLGGRSQRMEQRAHQNAYAAWFSPALDGEAIRRRQAYDLGISYAADAWRIYGKVGSTFRFANTDELFGYDMIRGVPVFAGNLRPQHGTVRELGGSFTATSLTGRLALYRMQLDDEIGYDGASGANVNFDPTRRQGLEAEAEWQLQPAVRTKLAYTLTEARFRGGPYDGKDVPLVARHKAAWQVSWDGASAGRYTAVVNYQGSRRYSGDLDNRHGHLPAHATLDLQAAWNLKPWTVTARLLNALDKRYAAYAGYSPYISDHYYYPADGRSLFLSARYDFR